MSMSNDNPTNEQELRKRIVLKLSAKLAAHTPLGDTEILNAASITAHLLPLIQSYTNAEIARTLDSLEAEFDRHAKSIGLWGMEGLMLDTLARTGNLSSEQKVERDAMVTERRALAVLHGAIAAERAKLKEVK